MKTLLIVLRRFVARMNVVIKRYNKGNLKKIIGTLFFVVY